MRDHEAEVERLEREVSLLLLRRSRSVLRALAGRVHPDIDTGLLTLPLIGGLLVASTVSGPALITTGLRSWPRPHHTTPVARIALFLVVLGLGIGMSMQNLVLAVQNTVDVRDAGAASSLVAFLRSLGGTVGVTVLGVVLSSRVAQQRLGLRAGGARVGHPGPGRGGAGRLR